MTEYERRKVSGECTYPGCSRPPADDGLLCEVHRERARARVRRSLKKRRAAWKKNGLCIYCGRKRQGAYACAACTVRLDRARTVANKREHNNAARIAERTAPVTEGDGRTRARYRGKHRGRSSAAEMDAEDIRAIHSSLRALEAGLVVARSPEVAALPLIQREETLVAALSHADVARRFLEDLLWRHDYPMERDRSE